MKKLNTILFILILCGVETVFAQSITINHQFQGISPSALSKGNHKMGWVTLDTIEGNPYTYNYMDSLQNITSFVDSNITIPYDSVFINGVMQPYTFGGDQLFVSQMDPNGHLWGLFYDMDLNNGYSDSSSVNFNIPHSCYYLYDFDNHQKHFLNVNQLLGTFSSYMANHKINFLNDTIYVTIDTYDVINDNRTLCIKWSNSTIISVGYLYWGISNVSMDVFIDHNSKLNYMPTSSGSNGGDFMLQSEGLDANFNPISYHQNVLIPTYPNYWLSTYDVCTHNNSTYILAYMGDNTLDTITVQEFNCVIVMNNAFDTIIPLPNGNFSISSSICVDHLDRIWVYMGDSIFMYDGNWIGFSLQGFSPMIAQPPNVYFLPEVYFVEYAENKFMISADGKGDYYGNLLRHGNGIIFINYNDPIYPGLNHVQGKVFYDSNNNGTYDMGEFSINNQIINAGAVNANTYLNGNYNLYLPNGAQSEITSNALPYLTSVPVAHNFNFSTQTDTSGINFAMQHTGPTNDLQINMIAGTHRTFQLNRYSIYYKNTGSTAANGTVTVQFDPLMSINNSYSYPAPTSSNPGILTWDFNNLQPFESRQIYFYLNSNNNFNIGDTVYAQASITPLLGDAIPNNNVDSTQITQ